MRRKGSTIALVLMSGLVATIAPFRAAAEEPSPEVPSASAPADAIRLSLVDRRMATYLLIDHQAEIDLADYAAAHAHDDAVKGYAQGVAHDYATFAKHWDERTGGQITAIARRISTSAEVSADTTGPETPSRIAFSLVNMERMLMSIKVEVAAQCAHAVQAELEGIGPAELDRSYLESQLFRQMQNVATLKVLQRYATPRMVPLLEDAAKLAQHHLDDAKAILATFARGGGAASPQAVIVVGMP
jgi:hypothetical protein